MTTALARSRRAMPVVIDLWPQDTVSSACFTDMARTFGVGRVRRLRSGDWHSLVPRGVGARRIAAIRPGDQRQGRLRDRVRLTSHEHSLPTQLYHASRGGPTRGASPTRSGHGVGLEVHEAPSLGTHHADTSWWPATFVAVEPSASADPAMGGVQIEDLVLVTDTGAETITRYAYDLEP